VAYDKFYEASKELAKWKKKAGFDVELVKYQDVAKNREELKKYFQKKFDEGDLTFIILVGDLEHIPALRGTYEGAYSDNMFVKLAGNDNIPDAFISRISVQDEEELKRIIKKTIDYEFFPTENAVWYKQALGIASSQGSPKDYERCEKLNETLENKLGFTKIWRCYDPDGGYWKNTENSSDKSIVFDAINNGVSVINYIGHGSTYSWVTSGFNDEDAINLENTGKYPVIWDVACVNGEFSAKQCFAEAWLRAGFDEDRPGGCIGIVAASTNESWVPPCVWQDEIIHEQLGNKKNIIGDVLNTYGLLKVAEQYGADDRSEGNKLIEQLIYFGDGTVRIRVEKPVKVSAEAIITDGKILVSVNGAVKEGLIVTAYDDKVEKNESAVTDKDGYATLPYNGQTMITVYGEKIVPVVDLKIQK
jgi:gingipain R/gingipain K